MTVKSLLTYYCCRCAYRRTREIVAENERFVARCCSLSFSESRKGGQSPINDGKKLATDVAYPLPPYSAARVSMERGKLFPGVEVYGYFSDRPIGGPTTTAGWRGTDARARGIDGDYGRRKSCGDGYRPPDCCIAAA